MSQKKISTGVVHEVPADLKKALTSDPQALTAWEDITPLARNEWICWIESAKKTETRSRRIEWGCSSLKDGKRRPCCWPGCASRCGCLGAVLPLLGHLAALHQYRTTVVTLLSDPPLILRWSKDKY